MERNIILLLIVSMCFCLLVSGNTDLHNVREARQVGTCRYLGPPCQLPSCSNPVEVKAIEDGSLCPRCPACKEDCRNDKRAIYFAKCRLCIVQGLDLDRN